MLLKRWLVYLPCKTRWRNTSYRAKELRPCRFTKPQNLDNSNWPDKGYVLTRNNDTTLWPYLEDSFVRDGYQALSPEQLKEGRDVE